PFGVAGVSENPCFVRVQSVAARTHLLGFLLVTVSMLVPAGLAFCDQNINGAPVLTEDAAYKKCVLEFLRERLYTKEELDEWLRPKKSAFSQYDPLLGYRNADRTLREGLDDSYVSYHYDDTGARRMINHADRPCRVNTYGSSFTDCEQV